MTLRIPLLLGVILFALPAVSATRMTFEINGAPTAIAWDSTAFPLRYEIDSRVAAAHPNAVSTIDRAFAAWAAVADTSVRFESRGANGSGTTHASDRVVVSVTDGLLRDQGAAAVTAYTYDTTNGRMLQASIRIDPELFDGSFSSALVVQHEVGHVLGLDHSAVISSVMYPYIGSAGASMQLDSDDVIAVRATYPSVDPILLGATLTGRVLGDSGGIHAAQVVAVNEHGYAVSTILTNPEGEFVLTGIPAGRYRLYAEPLDGPVDTGALQGTWRQARSFSFPTEFFDSPIDIESGKVYGNLVLTTTGVINLNPKWVGATPAGKNEISLSSAPVSLTPGDTFSLAVGGDGFTSGMTEFEILNPAFHRTSGFSYAANYVRATFTLDAKASPGSAVILVRSGSETAALTGALRVQSSSRARAVRR